MPSNESESGKATNICIQIFTLDQTRNVVALLHILEEITINPDRVKAVWLDHDGIRRAISVRQILKEIEIDSGTNVDSTSNGHSTIQFPARKRLSFNECYFQVPVSGLKPSWESCKCKELIIHFSVAPSCDLWAASSGHSGVRRVISYVQSLERALKRRTPPIMPTVFEISLKCQNQSVNDLLEPVTAFLTAVFARVISISTCAVADFGDDWLFIPKSGYNPNVSEFHTYFNPAAVTSWQKWRECHNLSAESGTASVSIHSLLPRCMAK